jgi:hypothetical protein
MSLTRCCLRRVYCWLADRLFEPRHDAFHERTHPSLRLEWGTNRIYPQPLKLCPDTESARSGV